MQHRIIEVVLAIVLFSIAGQVAATAPLPTAAAAPQPIIDATPYTQTDELKVIAFFKFGCPVCRNYHMSLEAWGRTLPKPFGVQFYPVLETDAAGEISDETTRGSMFFWAVERIGSKQQQMGFAEAAYSLSQDTHEQNVQGAWVGAVKSAGITQSRFVAAWNSEQVKWANRADRQAHYNPRVTPSLVICGKWMISPDSTNGNQELFFQLANGLVSKCMMEKGLAK